MLERLGSIGRTASGNVKNLLQGVTPSSPPTRESSGILDKLKGKSKRALAGPSSSPAREGSGVLGKLKGKRPSSPPSRESLGMLDKLKGKSALEGPSSPPDREGSGMLKRLGSISKPASENVQGLLDVKKAVAGVTGVTKRTSGILGFLSGNRNPVKKTQVQPVVDPVGLPLETSGGGGQGAQSPPQVLHWRSKMILIPKPEQ